MARSPRTTIALGLATALLVAAPTPGADEPLAGFAADEIAAQREWERVYRTLPRAENLRESMRIITEEPHIAGTEGSKRVAEYVLSRFRAWGLDAWIEEHAALMPLPVERELELVEPGSFRARLEEPVLAEDKDSSDAGLVPPFNAYAADGDVTAQLVYVNYGIPEDYEKLAEMGIDVRGKIVIARYGRSWRGIKAKLAQQHGAVGCIIYSDPWDDGYRRGDIYPAGPFRPWLGVQRGSIMDMPIHPGDPLTPGWGATMDGRRLARDEARTLVRIPVLPISYGDAQPLLERLGGPVAPEPWRGALPITYHVGPGPAVVRLRTAFEWKVRPLYNVLARIEGSTFPDEWILHGNHHDAWCNGAMDPTSGNVALMETARSLAELVRRGWKPKRTILLASWDGEEWGLLGSTEWAESHAEELREKAVVYLNTDSNGRGWLQAGGSHSLERLVNEVGRDIDQPETSENVVEAARARRLETAETEEEKARLERVDGLALGALGSGSDYTAFLDHLAIASLNVGFGGASEGGVYHSNYDSFTWYTRFGDPDFEHGRALSRLTGTILLRLAGATVLPFRFADLARTLGEYVDEIEKTHREIEGAPALDLGPVREAIAALDGAARAFDRALGRIGETEAARLETRADELRALNRLLYTTERRLGAERGLPNRPWFRHQVYAPGLYTGYGVKTLPGIRESVEQREWEEAARYVGVVAAAIESLAAQVDEARRALEALLS